MIVTDFDGTLFSDSHSFNDKDLATLRHLGEKGILRVIATGRSLFSANKVIPPDFPIDYLVFSSGAGIMEWKSREIISIFSLGRSQIKAASEILISGAFNFMLHKKIPDNHFFITAAIQVKMMILKEGADYIQAILWSGMIMPLQQWKRHVSLS